MFPVLFHLGAVVVPSYGVAAALGVLAALALAQGTARRAGLDANRIWNLSIAALFAAIVASRLLLVAINLADIRLHPSWLLALAMVHHPLLTVFGAAVALAVVLLYGRTLQLPLRSTADVLAAPLALGLAFEQVGALMAGSGYGTESHLPWAVTYTNPLAFRWSGAPLKTPLHPAQAYAALGYLLLAIGLVYLLSRRRQAGDAAGVFLAGISTVLFHTQFFRDPEGRGRLLSGALTWPQAAAIALLLAGAWLLRKNPSHLLKPELRSILQAGGRP